MKIQSASDIITNSSSEAFMVITNDVLQHYKELAANIISSFGINEPIDEVLSILPQIDKNDEYIMNGVTHLILTGHLVMDAYDEDDLEQAEQNEDYFTIDDGFPMCSNKEEITDEMFAKAAVIYNENSRSVENLEGCPPITGIEFKEKKPEYKKIAEALTNIVNFNCHEVFYC